jgi:hypothetical protein
MTRIALSLAAVAALLALLPGTPAEAQLGEKTYVSNDGSDTTLCTFSSPCATLQHAHDETRSGGEIGVLNPGDYGALTITKSINITDDGSGEASILPGLVGIMINAGPGDVISLRGLVLDGLIGASQGIIFNTGSALHIQNCVIRNFESFGGLGLNFQPSGHSQLFVSDTIIFNNGNTPGNGGVLIAPQGTGTADVVLDRVHLENNVDGLLIYGTGATGGGSHVVVRESVLSGNAANGIRAVTQPGEAPAFAYVTRSSSVNNAQNGILADGPRATVLLNDSTVARNAVGISTVNGGQLVSYRNNRINNNIGPDGAPTGFYTLN